MEATRDAVWNLIADVDHWSAWNPDVASASRKGPLASGTTFRWKAGGVAIISTLECVARPNEIGWTGRTFGLRAIHVWRLEERNGLTHIVTEESMSGLPARLFRRQVQVMLDQSLPAWLSAIEAEMRRRRSA